MWLLEKILDEQYTSTYTIHGSIQTHIYLYIPLYYHHHIIVFYFIQYTRFLHVHVYWSWQCLFLLQWGHEGYVRVHREAKERMIWIQLCPPSMHMRERGYSVRTVNVQHCTLCMCVCMSLRHRGASQDGYQVESCPVRGSPCEEDEALWHLVSNHSIPISSGGY